MKKNIELKILELRSKMQKMEETDFMAFTKEPYKILQAQCDVLAEILTTPVRN
jgi:hypothetical protein